MTRPAGLTLIPLDIPVERGMILGNEKEEIRRDYILGLDTRGTLYLIFQNPLPSYVARIIKDTSTQRTLNVCGTYARPRISISDPHWSPNHALRYVQWVTKC